MSEDKYLMMSILVQGSMQPGKAIDVYLRPLVDGIKIFWQKVSRYGMSTDESTSVYMPYYFAH